MKTIFLFKNSKKSLKLVKNDNFYSILLNRKVVCSSDYKYDLVKLYEFLVSKFILIGDLSLSYEINLCLDHLIIREHRNSSLAKISRSF